MMSNRNPLANPQPAPAPAPRPGPMETPIDASPNTLVTPSPLAQPGGTVPLAPAPQPVNPIAPTAVPVAILQPVVQPAEAPHQAPLEIPENQEPVPEAVKLFSHSNLFYWWPVWAVGYTLALMTWMSGTVVQVGNSEVLIHASKNLGVIYTLTFFLVILITNVTVRGVSSVVVILSAITITLALAYFNLWEDVLQTLGRLQIFMNLGFYLFFSSAIFFVWAVSFFFYDRLTYWRIRPGQVTLETVVGGAETSHDTRGMVFEKRREDLFRHWILGLGSGDLLMTTTGAKAETVNIPNVLFVNHKLHQIQRLIAMKPTERTT
jgi:hypothetical protein